MINTMKVRNKGIDLLAFTLFETLLVVLCCSLFLLLPVISIKSWQQRIEVQQFLSSFEKNVLFTQQMAIVNGINTCLLLDEEKQEMFFCFSEQMADRSKLTIPKILKVSGPKQIHFKKITGNNGNLSKFVFYWQSKKETVEYQIQMGSARFVKKIIKL